MVRAGWRSPVPGAAAGRRGPGVEGAVLDDGTDIEHADVDPFASHLGMQGLQVVTLGGLRGAGTAHVRLPPQGAGALRGEDGAVAPLKHVWEELLHEIEQRGEGDRKGVPGA